jgi:hypothetical protein
MNRLSPTTAPSSTDRRSGITVLAGITKPAVAAVARICSPPDRISPWCATTSAPPAPGNSSHRLHRPAVLEDETVALERGCVSCTLRRDVAPTLLRLASGRPEAGIVLTLPPLIEPETIAAACASYTVDGTALSDVVRFDFHVTVVEASTTAPVPTSCATATRTPRTTATGGWPGLPSARSSTPTRSSPGVRRTCACGFCSPTSPRGPCSRVGGSTTIDDRRHRPG